MENSYKDQCNAEHERDIDWADHRTQMQQDAGLEPAESPYFYPEDDHINESFGPDAWCKDQSKSGYGANDRTDQVIEKLRVALATDDMTEIGNILAPYAIAYLEDVARCQGCGMEFDAQHMGDV